MLIIQKSFTLVIIITVIFLAWKESKIIVKGKNLSLFIC